jgi:hypothetical protein
MTHFFHDFVLVPLGVIIPKAGSTGPARPKAGGSAILGDRTGTDGVIVPRRPIPSGRKPNQILTFRPCPRKLPKTQKQTVQTE